MAGLVCPCGCNTKVSRINVVKRGAVAGAGRALALVNLIGSIDTSVITDPDERREFDSTQADLRQLSGQLLDHVHGHAAPGRTPDLASLNATLTAYEIGFYGGA